MAETNTAPTELMLTVSGEETLEHLRALRDWLTLEEALRGRLRWHGETPKPGHMGMPVDVLMVALGSGGAGAVLARSLATWLVQRRTDVTVTVQAPNGGRVEVDVKRASDPERVIAEVRTLLGRLES